MEFHLIARSLNGVPVGLHQFIVIFTDSPRSFPLRFSRTTLTTRKVAGRDALVLGAHNIKRSSDAKYNRLTFIPFEAADLSAAVEYFGGSPSNLSNQFGYDKPTGVQFFPENGTSDLGLAVQILSAVDYYSVNENSYPIAYPLPWFGKNSNSWTNSILDVVKVANRSSIGDFSGADAANDVRIHPMYFQGRCKPCTIQNPAYR